MAALLQTEKLSMKEVLISHVWQVLADSAVPCSSGTTCKTKSTKVETITVAKELGQVSTSWQRRGQRTN
ncbi:hypothetical protein DPMN_142468 [Dreissena polymorpha]|uniref:Uncharacterized protein n=1 Tax=Dreissena polymorpha TaxID=45954 RepID=A0A9D4GHA7_DREPO|nr:hypothetical protein DPMN_142468 [Dreissena polymorpha]